MKENPIRDTLNSLLPPSWIMSNLFEFILNLEMDSCLMLWMVKHGTRLKYLSSHLSRLFTNQCYTKCIGKHVKSLIYKIAFWVIQGSLCSWKFWMFYSVSKCLCPVTKYNNSYQCVFTYIWIYIYTHTHIYMNIYRERGRREKERKKKRDILWDP